MDIRCPRCGEPYDLDELHGVVSEEHDRSEWLTKGKYDQAKYDPLFTAVRKRFREQGCVVFGSRCAQSTAHPAIGELYDLMGDDIDGAASLLEDFRLFL